jgi:hypothetical protein
VDKISELEEAAQGWEHFAEHDPTCNAALAESCRNAAKSLRLEEQTGVVHCACHLIPMEQCRQRTHK